MADDTEIIPHAKDADEEPRVPVRDAVWALRNALMDKRGRPSEIQSPLWRMRGELNAQLYPYTKGPEYANDLLSYGERVREKSRYIDGKEGLSQKAHVSRRTRSGRTPEELKASPNNGVDSVRPSHPPAETLPVSVPVMAASTRVPSIDAVESTPVSASTLATAAPSEPPSVPEASAPNTAESVTFHGWTGSEPPREPEMPGDS